MRKALLFLIVLTVAVVMTSTAHAKNEFEDGFKTELGAISARAAVGLGVGLVRGIVCGGPCCRPHYAPVYVKRTVYVGPYPRRWHGCHSRHRHHHHHTHYHYHNNYHCSR